MLRFSTSSLLLLVLLGFTAPCLAQANREVVELGKAATALVEVATRAGNATGSTFCVDKSGLFITNAHVIEGGNPAGKVRIVLWAGEENQRNAEADIVRVDGDLDLALLNVNAPEGMNPLPLGKDGDLYETMPVTAFGYPFGPALANISVNAIRISSLRKTKGELAIVQIDGQLNPGNSGGPILDSGGKVVGVATATVPGAGINFAIPVGRLADFLAAPSIVFDVPAIAYRDRARPVEWTISLQSSPFAKPTRDLSVSVTLSAGLGDQRSVAARSVAGGTYKVSVVPVPGEAERRVGMSANIGNHLGGQSMSFAIKDIEVQIGRESFHLSELPYIQNKPVHRAITTTGRTLTGAFSGLGELVIPWLFDRTVVVNPSEVDFLVVRSTGAPLDLKKIDATVEVKQGSRVVTRLSRSIAIEGGPAILPAVASEPLIPNLLPQPSQSVEDHLDSGGVLNVGDDAARGAGKAILPPSVAMGEARLGDARPSAAGVEVRRLLGHTNEVMDLVLSRDGRYLVTCDLDGIIRVWDPTSGTTRHTLRGHRGEVSVLAMSPDGRRVLSGGADHVLRLWDIERGQLLSEFQGHSDMILAIAFTPDGRRCLSAGGARSRFQVGADRDIWVRDLENGRVIARWPGHTGIIDALAVSPDGKLALSSSSDQTARLWDIATGRELHRFAGQPELDLHAIFSPDGRRTIVTSAGHLIRIFDVATGRKLLELPGHTAKVDSLAASPDGRLLVSGSHAERMFRIWDLTDGRALGQISLEGNPQLGSFTPDGRRIMWSFSDNTVREFTLTDSLFAFPRPDAPGPSDPLVRRLDGKIGDVAGGGGGRYLLLAMRDRKQLVIFDVNVADVVKRIPLPSDDTLIAAGAEKFVLISPRLKRIERWALATLERETESPSPIDGRVTAIAMGCDSAGPILASWAGGQPGLTPWGAFSFIDLGTLKVLRNLAFNQTTGNQVRERPAASGVLPVVQFTSGQNCAIRASADGCTFGLWRIDTAPPGFMTFTIRGKQVGGTYVQKDVGHVVPSPDGQVVFTGAAGVLDLDAEPAGFGGRTTPPTFLIPSTDQRYYLGIRVSANPKNAAVPRDVTIFDAKGSALAIVTGLDEMPVLAGPPYPFLHDPWFDKRYHFVPAGNLLITVPPTNDRLVVRRLSLGNVARTDRSIKKP